MATSQNPGNVRPWDPWGVQTGVCRRDDGAEGETGGGITGRRTIRTRGGSPGQPPIPVTGIGRRSVRAIVCSPPPPGVCQFVACPHCTPISAPWIRVHWLPLFATKIQADFLLLALLDSSPPYQHFGIVIVLLYSLFFIS